MNQNIYELTEIDGMNLLFSVSIAYAKLLPKGQNLNDYST